MSQNEEFKKYKELLHREEFKICQACGGELVFEKVNLEDYQGGKLYIMEKVPAFVCQHCAEIWVPEPIMKEFERMIETAQQRKSPRRGKNGK